MEKLKAFLAEKNLNCDDFLFYEKQDDYQQCSIDIKGARVSWMDFPSIENFIDKTCEFWLELHSQKF